MIKNSSSIRFSWELEDFGSFSFVCGQCWRFSLRTINIAILTVSARIYVAKNVRLSNVTPLIVGRQASTFLIRTCDLESITKY